MLVNANTATASWAARLLLRLSLFLALPLFCFTTVCLLPLLGFSTAKMTARRVCDRARVGQPVAPVIAYARRHGLRDLTRPLSSSDLQGTYLEARSRGSVFYCDIQHDHGLVRAARVWGITPWD